MELVHPPEFASMRNFNSTYDGNILTNSQAESDILTERIRHLQNLSPAALPAFFILDYTHTTYKFLSESFDSVISPNVCQFMEEQLKWAVNIITNDELNIYNESVFEANMSFLRAVPQSDHHKYLFSNVFKVKSARGELKQVLQRGTYITAKESGSPLYSLGILLDISYLNCDDILTLSVEKILDGNGIFNTRMISNPILYPHESDCLTQQEKKVVRLLAEGYSSKQLASKLFLSEHTIISHRKNLLKKTNTKNVAQLIAFCIKNKLI